MTNCIAIECCSLFNPKNIGSHTYDQKKGLHLQVQGFIVLVSSNIKTHCCYCFWIIIFSWSKNLVNVMHFSQPSKFFFRHLVIFQPSFFLILVILLGYLHMRLCNIVSFNDLCMYVCIPQLPSIHTHCFILTCPSTSVAYCTATWRFVVCMLVVVIQSAFSNF